MKKPSILNLVRNFQNSVASDRGADAPAFEDSWNIQFVRYQTRNGPLLVLYEETGGMFKGNFNVCLVPDRKTFQTAKLDAEIIGAIVSDNHNRPVWPKNLQIFLYTQAGVSPFEGARSKFEVVKPDSQKTVNAPPLTEMLGDIPQGILSKVPEIERQVRVYEDVLSL